MTNTEAGYGNGARTPRQGLGGSPVGSWLSIALAVIALIAGFLILRNITDDSSADANSSLGVPADDETETDDPTGEVDIPETTTTTTTTMPARVTDGASVIVANANSVNGSAGDMTDEIEGVGYSVESPVNASGGDRDDSIVLYDSSVAGSQEIAQSVARDLGGLSVEETSPPVPTESGDLSGAGVLVVLGNDEAGQTIEALSGASTDDTGVVDAPDPVGADSSDEATVTDAEDDAEE